MKKIVFFQTILLFFQGCIAQQNQSQTENLNKVSNYYPIATWSGRLILPLPIQRKNDGGVFIELANTPSQHKSLLRKKLWLTYSQDSTTQMQIRPLFIDINFDQSTAKSIARGNHHPFRLNGLKLVSPLESLAGARAEDNVEVLLRDVVVKDDVLYIKSEPVQITGEQMGLVKFIGFEKNRLFRVKHWGSDNFNGPEELVNIPRSPISPKPRIPISYAEIKGIEKTKLNEDGWYIYGHHNSSGQFVVRALEPRKLTQDKQDAYIIGRSEIKDFIANQMWANASANAYTSKSYFLIPEETRRPQLKLGDKHLVIHEFGNAGGEKGEGKSFGIATGHFAFGIAHVVFDPITQQNRLQIEYKQVYAHNKDQIIAGSQLRQHFLGSLERGWAYTHPTADAVIFYPLLEQDYILPNGDKYNPLDVISSRLEAMHARYRTGNGDGASNVSAASSCVQDANQALYLAVWPLLKIKNELLLSKSLRNLQTFAQRSFQFLLPYGLIRKDWEHNALDFSYGQGAIKYEGTFFDGLTAANTLFPRTAFDKSAELFIDQKAPIYLQRNLFMGGKIDGIEPLPPESLFRRSKN